MTKSIAACRHFRELFLALCFATVGCSGSDPESQGNSGGSPGSGGSDPTTTSTVGSGGKSTVASGGSNPTAGSPATGGTAGSGVSSQPGGGGASAGQASTGGASVAGTTATGGNRAMTTTGTAGGTSATGGSVATGGAASATGGKATTAGASSTGGVNSTAGSSSTTPVPVTTPCSSALPTGAQPADVSNPTTVVGTGTATSCTFSALSGAVTKGGIITFDCGAAPVSIDVTATMNLPTNKDTVIDGGGKVTLDGGGAVRILSFSHLDWMVNDARVTLQHLTLVNGKATPTEQIPTAPEPCSQGWYDGQGGALYMRDGNLTVIDCSFSNNQAAALGPDTGGGAIYINGSKRGALIVGSRFTGNSASNAGAVGGLFAELDIYNSLFENNTATGNGANGNEPSKCSVIINDQNQTGSGGNGGAIYQDGGASTNIVLCGNDIINNAAGAGAFGGGVFMTSNDWSGTLTVQDCKITGNTGGSWTQVQEGSVNRLGSAFGVNALSISLRNSTLQGI